MNVISTIMVSRLMLNLRNPKLLGTGAMRTAESTTLHDPITTVIPYQQTTTGWLGLSVADRFESHNGPDIVLTPLR
ncbi:hypothetical protein B0H10DRAFT_2043963 [Mycena sp. CBHHK59/15]|nr:hypothetical protein B0H10DRAFT_2043963 [Mycena sp. CBHHK59/15]